MTVELMRGAQHLTLERLREATGTPLLLLHALRGCRGDWNPSALAWDGPVWALDLSGHGESGWLHGSVYSPEQFAADADIALAHIGAPLCVAGAGSGGYAALLLAGARNADILGAAVLPGAGLEGGGEQPDEQTMIPTLPERGDPKRDPFDPRVVLADAQPRPTEYATSFARRARRLVLLEPAARPPHW